MSLVSPKPAMDARAFSRGEAMISFGGSFIMFWVRGHSKAQAQRMTMSSAALFSGASGAENMLVLCEDLMGGQAYNPHQLIAVPTYGYRMVLSEAEHAIYREYMPPRNSGGDSFGSNADLFSEHRLSLQTFAARRLTREEDVERAVVGGAIVNGFAQAVCPGSNRTISLQFPIRYFSVRSGPQAEYHAEAGPVLIPRAALGDGSSETAESMHIAQIGYNRWNEAEIAVWGAEPSAGASSRWFSKIYKLKAELSFLVRADFK